MKSRVTSQRFGSTNENRASHFASPIGREKICMYANSVWVNCITWHSVMTKLCWIRGCRPPLHLGRAGGRDHGQRRLVVGESSCSQKTEQVCHFRSVWLWWVWMLSSVVKITFSPGWLDICSTASSHHLDKIIPISHMKTLFAINLVSRCIKWTSTPVKQNKKNWNESV